MIVDTSALLAYFDSGDTWHAAVSGVIDPAREELVVSPFVVAELDYLVATRIGVDAELQVLDELSGGAWELPAFGPSDIAEARAVVAKYRDLRIGVADASNVVLADRWDTRRVVTLDRRRFSVLRTQRGRAFILLPA